MFKKFKIVPRRVIFLLDLSVCSFSLLLAYFISFNFSIDANKLKELGTNLVIVLLITSITFINFKSYSGIVRYTSLQDGLRISMATTCSTTFLFIINLIAVSSNSLFFSFPTIPLLIYTLLSFFILIGYRLLVRFGFTYLRNLNQHRKTLIIYGAGEAGVITKKILDQDTHSNSVVVAFLDDDIRKVGKLVNGVQIYHSVDFYSLCEKHKIDELIIAAFNLSPNKKNELVDYCLDREITVLTVPPMEHWINGQFQKRQLQSIKIEQLLERDPIRINNSELSLQLHSKRILVTGAAGSIGSELVRQLLKFQPKILILCDVAETPLYHLELQLEEIKKKTNCIYFLGNVTNEKRMEELFHLYQPQYIYHAAAYKHVPMMESCPSEAILTNVQGTKIIADLAAKFKAQRFVMISTDKAVNPTSVMGASKGIAENYIQFLHIQNSIKGEGVKFITTRFGNVLGSNGSVIPLFKEQIENGGPVTVTHPDIVRYFMTIPEACQLVLEAGSMGNGGEIFVFDMGKSIKIVELAKTMIRLYGFVPGIDIDIKFTGLRPGEKLFEELLADSENSIPTYNEKILIAKTTQNHQSNFSKQLEELFQLATQKDSDLLLVSKMKELVPEFISKNSEFEVLDEKRNESKVISITRSA